MNLGQEFIRAAVRQVGRDGGKVISNKIYNGQHGTPIYDSGKNGMTSKQIVDVSEIDMSIQPKIKGGGIVPVLKGLFFQIVPVIGHIAVLIKGLSYLNKTTTSVYASAPNKVVDRRYKVGYRIDGYSIVKTNVSRQLEPYEQKMLKSRGISYLISLAIGVFFFSMLILSGKTAEDSVKYGYAKKDKVSIKQEPSINSAIVIQVPQGDSVKIVDSNGPVESVDGVSANWIKIEYADKTGWIWGGLIDMK
jgi:hypothetical protein